MCIVIFRQNKFAAFQRKSEFLRLCNGLHWSRWITSLVPGDCRSEHREHISLTLVCCFNFIRYQGKEFLSKTCDMQHIKKYVNVILK
jgi:hypothetical protein